MSKNRNRRKERRRTKWLTKEFVRSHTDRKTGKLRFGSLQQRARKGSRYG